MTQAKELQYTLAQKGALTIASFNGSIIRKNLEVLEKCKQELLKQQSKFIILSFQNVDDLDLFSVPALAQFQKAMRDKPAVLRICLIRHDFRELLEGRGAMKKSEIANELTDAIRSLAAPSAQKVA